MSELSMIEIARLNEAGESDAWVALYRSAPEKFSKQYGVAVRQVGSLQVTMIPGMDTPFFNRISGLGLEEKASEAMLDDAIAVLEKAGIKNYMAQVSPMAKPEELHDWLTSRELRLTGYWSKVYRDNRPAPSIATDLRVEMIDKKLANTFADVVLAAFEMPMELHSFISAIVGLPGWLSFIAFDSDQPAAAGALFVKGGIGWLGMGATLPAQRKRGGQGAIMARRISEGIKMGCKWFVTETGKDSAESPNPSYHNMLRTGFQLAYHRPNYIHKAA